MEYNIPNIINQAEVKRFAVVIRKYDWHDRGSKFRWVFA